MSEAADRWESLVAEMLVIGSATHGSEASAGPKRAFGATSLKTSGRIFAMLVHDRLVVKLPAGRVEALVEDGIGRRFDPGHGRIQREWLDVGSDELGTWVALATESEAFVARGKA